MAVIIKLVAIRVDDNGKEWVVYDSGPQNVADETVSDLTVFLREHLEPNDAVETVG